MQATAVIADDHGVMREGLFLILEATLNVSVLTACSTGDQVVDALRTHTPDLLILDLALPRLNGLSILRQIRSLPERPSVVVFSAYGADRYVREAIDGGASAFVLKGDDPAELQNAVQAVLRGDTYVSHRLRKILVSDTESPAPPKTRFDLLTQREREVLQLVAEGLTSREISDRLYISPRTVDKHRENLTSKLGVNSTASLVQFALQHDLIQGADPPAFDDSVPE